MAECSWEFQTAALGTFQLPLGGAGNQDEWLTGQRDGMSSGRTWASLRTGSV